MNDVQWECEWRLEWFAYFNYFTFKKGKRTYVIEGWPTLPPSDMTDAWAAFAVWLTCYRKAVLMANE